MSDLIAQRLKCAAAELFLDYGFAANRVADIVGTAGVAQGTFYLHFKNKPAIFVSLIDDFFSGLIKETLGHYPAQRLRTNAQQRAEIEMIWNTVIRYSREHSSLTKLVLRESQALPAEQRRHIGRHFERGADVLSEYVQDAQRRGLVKGLPAQLTAWLVIGLIERTMHYAVFVAPNARSDVLAAHCAEFELSGLLAVAPAREGGRR